MPSAAYSHQQHGEQGARLLGQGDFAGAAASYRRALELKPDWPDAHCGLGYALQMQGDVEGGIASYRKALGFKPDFAGAWLNLGLALQAQGDAAQAIESYRKAIEIQPDFADAHYNLGLAFRAEGRQDEAIASYRRAVALRPGFVEAHYNLGNALLDQGGKAEAADCYRRALELRPAYADACNNLGIVLGGMSRHEEAIACFERLLSLRQDYPFALGQLQHIRMHCCDWRGLDEASRRLLDGIAAGKAVSPPFPLLALESDPAQQKRCAEIYVREKYPPGVTVTGNGDRYAHDRIRLGYFSSDFYGHATAYLMAELFELHDRNRFEVIAFSFGAAPDDEMRKRLSVGFDRFFDVRNHSDREVAALARKLEIDIAIDLKGFTEGLRTGIFALRPAPIQVNYLGYPGTMAAPYMDYLIADPVLIPPGHRQYYSEKIAYLPDTYQVNDRHRRISERLPSRGEVGLPEEGFVFCCFNNNYKITPAVFDIWMRLLKQVEGSVLWLLGGNALVQGNLRREAAARGVAPERLVFAPRVDMPDHLARQRLADLFLDTFLYNAHTTASDALWVGLPVLTCLGETFAGRVAASLLRATGLQELIAYSGEEYYALALGLAGNPERLLELRRKLESGRSACALFDTVRFARHIEKAYDMMWQRHQARLPPEHIHVEGAG